jgi:pimeloyl-ACP methyl ester carboxylesterase
MTIAEIETLNLAGRALAVSRQHGGAPTFVWLGGFKSEMSGTKASVLAGWTRAHKKAFVRFDYSGHGQSGGRFADGTVGQWAAEAIAVIDACTTGPLVLVGSSMGAWLALLAAAARPDRVAGLLLIAPAADFTERLMWAEFSDDVKREIETKRAWARPSAYGDEPYVITKRLIEDGRRWLIMDGPIPFSGPVRILQGGRDPDVPEAHARALAALIQSPDLRFDLIPDGDHRLSRPQDLAHLTGLAAELAARLPP